MKPAYKPNFEKFLDSLTPEQMMFLGSIFEQDIAAKDHANIDNMANLIYDRTQHLEAKALQERTLDQFFDKYFPIS
ncbi:MAG: hypothetical protein HY22_03920 [[Candidatus Thermochlorobacteriaceae] bacterium GBChlB]|nr:MAG: hypothetical protein HY22_03920 [[Candidatus Thermochlorobacteriaceae] bacterium GBChlB]